MSARLLPLLSGAETGAPPPGELNPQVVEAPFSFLVRQFDLTKAFEESKAGGHVPSSYQAPEMNPKFLR